MINNFNSYNELRDYCNTLSKNALEKIDYLNKLKILVQKGSFGEEYYAKQNNNLKVLAEELSKCVLLKNNISKYYKTNGELINIILSHINASLHNKYKVRIIQVSGYDESYELDTTFCSLTPINFDSLLFSVFLVRNDIADTNIASQIHDKEKYRYLTENHYVIDLRALITSIDGESIKTFLNDKTIDINDIVGLSKEVKDTIREELFQDYKKEYAKNKSYICRRNGYDK